MNNDRDRDPIALPLSSSEKLERRESLSGFATAFAVHSLDRLFDPTLHLKENEHDGR